jgi:uncharacterized protein (TIGR03790 family)
MTVCTRLNRIFRLFLVGCFLLGVADFAAAELQPDEVAVIAVRNSPQSRELAAHYVKLRGVPESHVCLIDVAPAKELSRRDWETSVRPAIRRWVAENELQTKLRCFVTTWDVPYKIGKADANSPRIAGRIAFLQADRTNRVERLLKLIHEANALLPGGETRDASHLTSEATQHELSEALKEALTTAQQRLRGERDRETAQQADAAIRRIFTAGGGAASMLRGISGQQPATPEAKAELARRIAAFQGRLFGLREGRGALESLPETVERDEQILAIVTAADGLLGALTWIDAQLELLNKNETYASFDSELSLLYWPEYPLLRWQPNLLNYRFDRTPVRDMRPTLMVARLEAPTFELAKNLVDTAVKVEQNGLQGRAYFDARGIKAANPSQPDTKALYDGALRELAQVLKDHTKIETTLNDEDALFQAGDCPDAALYCGWYSLAKYVDAFDWQPGAVAYHMASSEAATLRDAKSEVWCKRMLEEGVCATIGPVHEPYLEAFPRPDEFFALLLSGQYTLAECYYRSSPTVSWVMVLIGDPLYNPYRANPALSPETLPDPWQRLFQPPDGEDDPDNVAPQVLPTTETTRR